MPLSFPDLLQRGVVLTSVGLTVYGGVLIAHGIGSRALRARGYLGGVPELDDKSLTNSDPHFQPPPQPS